MFKGKVSPLVPMICAKWKENGVTKFGSGYAGLGRAQRKPLTLRDSGLSLILLIGCPSKGPQFQDPGFLTGNFAYNIADIVFKVIETLFNLIPERYELFFQT